ncbi:hypothetical protein GCM10020295_52530 [Streptomyces cinereospinus]
MPRQPLLGERTREACKGLGRVAARPRLRSTAAVFTILSALAATSLITCPSVAEPFAAAPCALARTQAHHSEGLDTWNAAYPRRPARWTR